MKRFLPILLLLFGAAITIQAGSPVSEVPAKGGYDGKAVTEADPEWGGPILGAGLMSNDEFTEAALFLVHPLHNTIGEGGTMGGTVCFIEPYGTWAEAGELGGSLGVGFRHLFSNQSVSDALSGEAAEFLDEGVFIGANFFIDYAESVNGNGFWQSGAGVEAGTRYVEFRSNYYYPHTDAETLGSRTETRSRSRSSTSSRTALGTPTVSGTSVVQSATRTTTTTTRTTTTRTSFELFEEALEGWDVEVAVLLPYIDQYCDVKLVGGFYDYSGERGSGSDFDGWRAGVEIRPIPAVVMHATWFESERLYKDNWLAGVRVELPLDDMKSALTPRRRHLAERLFEPVHRKNTAITFGGEEQEVDQNTSISSDTDIERSGSTNNLGPAPMPPMMTVPPPS